MLKIVILVGILLRCWGCNHRNGFHLAGLGHLYSLAPVTKKVIIVVLGVAKKLQIDHTGGRG